MTQQTEWNDCPAWFLKKKFEEALQQNTVLMAKHEPGSDGYQNRVETGEAIQRGIGLLEKIPDHAVVKINGIPTEIFPEIDGQWGNWDRMMLQLHAPHTESFDTLVRVGKVRIAEPGPRPQ